MQVDDEENEVHGEEGTNEDEVAPVAPVMQVDDEENEAHGEEGTNKDEVAPVAPVMQVDEVMDERYGRRLGKYNLRARKPRDYSHLHATLESIVMTQHSARKGLRIFGEAGVDAVLKELTQLYDRKVIRPRGKDEMTGEEREAALQYLMFLKKKRDGTVKGRGCADDPIQPRRKQAHQQLQLSPLCYPAQLMPRKREMWGWLTFI